MEDDDIMAKMTLEMEGRPEDVNPMESRQGSRATALRGATGKGSRMAKPSMLTKKKVKGNLGLAIHHGGDVADAVQLNYASQNFDEDDVLGDPDGAAASANAAAEE